LESEPQPKSINNQMFLEKGIDPSLNAGNDGKIVLSASRNKTEILKALDECVDIEKAEHETLATNMVSYESSGYLTKDLISELGKTGIQVVQ